jgi:hypothetical protein
MKITPKLLIMCDELSIKECFILKIERNHLIITDCYFDIVLPYNFEPFIST